jgi:hypothetical protein
MESALCSFDCAIAAVAAQAHRDLRASPFQVIRAILAGRSDLCNNRFKFPGPAVLLEQLEKTSRGDGPTGKVQVLPLSSSLYLRRLAAGYGRGSDSPPNHHPMALRPPAAAYVPCLNLP